MKKYTCFILILCLLLTCLFSCGPESGNNDTDSDASVYERLDRMVGEGYSSLTIRVKTEVGSDVELESEYRLEKTSSGERISYTVQQLSRFTNENGELSIPDERTVTLRGEAVVSGGRVVIHSGDSVDTDLSKVGLPDFDFDESYFSNVNDANGRFFADVTAPAKFMGTSGSFDRMTAEVVYTDSGISTISICYVSDGLLHRCDYIFA